MDALSHGLFLRDLSKLNKDPHSDGLLFANRVPLDKITVFGIVVNIEATSLEEFTIQIDDSSGLADVLISKQLVGLQQSAVEKGVFVVVCGFIEVLDFSSRCTVVALDLKTAKEPIEELLVELEAIQYYKRYYYPKLFPCVEERRGAVDSTVLALEEILHMIRKNHGMTFSAIEKTFVNYSKEQLVYFLSKLMDNFSIYKHEDIYFPL
ncbi:hypothetical protein Gasu2_66680 [Galdieria sulphuraria]|uniref:CST complex subunit Stn1 N-terminal domain-containing protein n=1 Tax=Galdieria sulphuraria TaxID=130081 RepID=M2XTX6_GALSU|nr:uncharacterized protein Gasu_55360 [Galdieria sulphuraria]EME26849.1 hypothetical protein Gasu_55360 [Galdieria sulphuraria]GJD12593.1 hypothetical protein Gasu2_66680 [Galdieria sulphuraria]|eukprot:XP_005703369.1 hypothetical protein Gasu_55360 [Galdieria sulphuraria]